MRFPWDFTFQIPRRLRKPSNAKLSEIYIVVRLWFFRGVVPPAVCYVGAFAMQETASGRVRPGN